MTGSGDLRLFELVDGRSRQPAETLDHSLTYPDTGEPIGPQRASSRSSIEVALAAADRVHANGEWMRVPVAERCAILERFSTELAARAEELALANSIDSGVPLSFSRTRVGSATGLPGLLANHAATLLHTALGGSGERGDQYWLPWGPAAIFVPWNAPTTMAILKAASALAAGAPVILKPSEWAPHASSIVGEAACAADLPASVLQVLHGGAAVGEVLAADPRIRALSYTGGVVGGRAVAGLSAAHMRPVDLELSGCNPVLVLADADVAQAARLIAGGMRILNGQWCAGPRRVFAPTSTVNRLADAILAEHGEHTVLGPIASESTTLGPMANAPHLRRLRCQLDAFAAAGATLRTAGSLPRSGGHFLLPTVVTEPPAELSRQEVFGPVITISGYRDVDDAVSQANDHDFGLSGYVLCGDRDAGRAVGRRLRAGYVFVNRIGLEPLPAEAVLSMWGSSGLGAVGISEGIRFFTGARFVG